MDLHCETEGVIIGAAFACSFNSGVWFMHCHFDCHVVWGMDTVFIVKDGTAPEAKMMRPPPNMPKC